MDFDILALIIISASFFGLFFRKLKQSPIVGYIFAGLLLGLTHLAEPNQSLDMLSKIGVMFLLFLLGLELKVGELFYLGRDVVIIAILQVLATGTVGFFTSLLLGFEAGQSVVVGLALSFSSTIIVVKMLSDSKRINSLSGRLSVGILLVQDVFAIAMLSIVGSTNGDLSLEWPIVIITIITLFMVLIFLHKFIIEKLFSYAQKYPENLFVLGVGWLFLLSLLVERFFGLSLEMGGLIAGLSLSAIKGHSEIFSKIKPIKDLFLTIFFVVLGINLSFGLSFSFDFIIPVVIFVLFATIGKSTITSVLLALNGYSKKVIFETSLSLSQISEFSIILISASILHLSLDKKYLAIITLSAVITMAISAQLFSSSKYLYSKSKRFLVLIEKFRNEKKSTEQIDHIKQNHVVLMGCDKSGSVIMEGLLKNNTDLVVVDFDPKIIKQVEQKNVSTILGDGSDIEIMDMAQVERANMIISTIPSFEDNTIILDYVKKINSKCTIILTAQDPKKAKKLLHNGADYVIFPEFLAGEYVSGLISSRPINKEKIVLAGKNLYKIL